MLTWSESTLNKIYWTTEAPNLCLLDPLKFLGKSIQFTGVINPKFLHFSHIIWQPTAWKMSVITCFCQIDARQAAISEILAVALRFAAESDIVSRRGRHESGCKIYFILTHAAVDASYRDQHTNVSHRACGSSYQQED